MLTIHPIKTTAPAFSARRNPAPDAFTTESFSTRIANKIARKQSPQQILRQICNTGVGPSPNHAKHPLTVAKMLLLMGEQRYDSQGKKTYPGWGTLEELTRPFPNVNLETLNKGFTQLCRMGYVGRDASARFWLRPQGLKMVRNLYPDLAPPAGKRLVTLAFTR